MVLEPPNIIRDQRMDKIIVLGHFFFTPKKFTFREFSKMFILTFEANNFEF